MGGTFFDTGKSEVKPESAAALQEVVKLLQQDPNMKVYVVGHTDNVGLLSANMELSRGGARISRGSTLKPICEIPKLETRNFDLSFAQY